MEVVAGTSTRRKCTPATPPHSKYKQQHQQICMQSDPLRLLELQQLQTPSQAGRPV